MPFRRSPAYFSKMSTVMSAPQQVVLEDQLIPAFRAILADGPAPSDPAELELLAATLLVPLELPDMPSDVASAFFSEIEQYDDQGAAGILVALAALATGEIATSARTSAQRLARGGVTPTAIESVGASTVREARRVARSDAELLVVLLGRPRTRRLQVAILGIEHEETEGALVECVLTPPLPRADARSMLESLEDNVHHAEPIGIDALAERATSAARRAKDIGVALGYEAAIAMPIIARALTGDPAGLARPETVPPWEDDDAELIVDAVEDEDHFHELSQRLLDELERWARATCPPEGPVWRSADFVASTMLEWKGGYSDGYLGRWTGTDLAEFLLDYFPRKVSVHRDTLDDVVDCVIAFLCFLHDRESLSGEPLEVLEETCDALREDFQTRAMDRSSHGLAKSLVMQMLEEGIDPSDAGALERWITDYNERSRAERHAIIGDPADRMSAQKPPTGRSSAKRSPSKTDRRAQRAARKRNRRSH